MGLGKARGGDEARGSRFAASAAVAVFRGIAGGQAAAADMRREIDGFLATVRAA